MKSLYFAKASKFAYASFLSALICCFSFPAFSQNWIPIVQGDVYHYELMGDTLDYDSINIGGYYGFINNRSPVDATIWIDSTESTGSTTIAHLNKIISYCDSCAFDGYSLRNQPQFLLHEMENMGNGVYQFTGGDSLIVETLGGLGSTWSAYPNAGINAEVIEVGVLPVFGIPDDIKVILLSNSDTMILSKEHGLLRFPSIQNNAYYQLSGIQTRELGIRIPMAEDMYGFNVNDIFQYSYGSSNADGGSEGTIKIEVLGRQNTADSIIYEIRRIKMGIGYIFTAFDSQTWNIIPLDDTLTYAFDKRQDIVSNYPRHLFDEQGTDVLYWSEPYTYGAMVADYVTIHYGQDQNGNWLKWMGDRENWLQQSDVYSHFTEQDNYYSYYDNEADIINQSTCIDTYQRIWQPGLGETTYSFSCYQYGEGRSLTAYVKDGDTTGIIQLDSVLLDTSFPIMNEDIESEFAAVKLFPNPAYNQLNFELQSDYPISKLSATIYDTSGKAWQSYSFDHQHSGMLDISHLPSGVYLLSFKTAGGWYSEKFVKW